MQKQLSAMLETTKQDSEFSSKEWIETSIWTRNMLTALGNGVKDSNWFNPSTYFAKLGLFTNHEAWVVACQSR